MSESVLSSPPGFDRRCDEYSKWKKLYNVWNVVTQAAKKTRGGLIILSLDEETRDEVLEQITIDDIKGKKSAEKVIHVLDNIFKKDESLTAYNIYEEFETYTRPANCAVSDYCNEFRRKYQKVKATGTELSEPVLAYRLLKSANLNKADVRLIKATVPLMTFDEMSQQLNKTFLGEIPNLLHSVNPTKKKRKRQNKGDQWIKRKGNSVNEKSEVISSEKSEVSPIKSQKIKERNPLDFHGNRTRCKICESRNHRENDCPDKEPRKMFQESVNQSLDSYTDDNILTYRINYFESLQENDSKNMNATDSSQNAKLVSSPTKKEKRLQREVNQQYVMNTDTKQCNSIEKCEKDQPKNGSESLNTLSTTKEVMDKHLNGWKNIRSRKRKWSYNNQKSSVSNAASYNVYPKSYVPKCFTCYRLGHVCRDCPIRKYNHTDFSLINNVDMPVSTNYEKQTENWYHDDLSSKIIPRGHVVKNKYHSVYRCHKSFHCGHCGSVGKM